MDIRFSLTLPREPAGIPVVRRLLGDALRSVGVAEECVADILLATSEACSNAVRHGGPTARYDVDFRLDGGRCVLKIRDRGRGLSVVPDEMVPPPPEAENGRGIQIMKAVVDDVAFEDTPGAGTTVWLRKHLAWQEDAPLPQLERELAALAS
ncbi:ATP-binding protein [Bailinhaonella thermotolerans]|uniref:ATP-binding protein n=1 Tax=Bailinhaonella thermotolerans TaxID=1070861 RepID=A0A3A4AYP0_9ACTN|nr:ATP-binding protein [Bailinhaonella thermotolerans]RJL30963.1 ATP-binding protein [Bailinhaonella thermotolerans]